jgi:hypothetical protein
MIILGAILLIIGFLTGIPIVWTLGLIALVVGLILVVAWWAPPTTLMARGGPTAPPAALICAGEGFA